MSQTSEELDIIGHIVDSAVMEFFNWELHLPTLHIFGYELPITKHVVMMWIVSILMMAIMIPIARQKSMAPRGIMRNMIESVFIFIRDEVAISEIGHHGVHFVPFLATLFFFILFCNLLGLVPFCATATGNLSVTAALALISFLTIHLSGMAHHGFFHYFKAIVPEVPWWLFPLMFVIEVIGHLAKPFSLAIRLFANMTAGHVVLLAFLSIIFIFKNLFVAAGSVGAAVAVSCLEILVAFIQAFVFTYLTSVFIGSVLSEH